jgi:hypothetical protein
MADRLYDDTDVETVADALRHHYIDLDRNDRAQDADHCACGPLVEDWDEHWAEVMLDALTAAGWHRGGSCIRLTREHMEHAEQIAARPDDREDLLDRMLAAGWQPKRWAPRARVAEEIARHFEERGEHSTGIPPFRAAQIARQHSTGGDHA